MNLTLHELMGPALPAFAGMDRSDTLASVEEAPDARLYLTDELGRVCAQAALWWKDTPVLDGKSIGAIGGFAAEGEEAALRILEAAAGCLRNAGCRIAVGPMNGNTWRRHRFVVESNGREPFLLEPRNSARDPEWWQTAGFAILSQYSSSVMPLESATALPVAVRERLLRSNLKIRSLDLNHYESELKRIHAISLRSFSNNFLYTSLDEAAFLDAYLRVRQRVDADFVRIAERHGVVCGFVFGIPDFEAAMRGEKPALIVKTLAVDPEARCAGLGNLLVDELHQAARAKGYVESIHALQHESNSSLKITGRHQGECFRRYALFSKPL